MVVFQENLTKLIPKNSKEKTNRRRDIIILFLVCFIPRVFVNLFIKMAPGGHDDLGMLIVPSMLAGYDWSGLIPETAYYGFGYSIIFTPILYFFRDNSYLMFQLIFGINAVFQALSGVVIYNLLINHYNCRDKKIAMGVSVALSYLVFTASCKVANDVILPCITWILIWVITILVERHENRRDKIRYTILLFLVLSYSLLLHSRSIIYWLGLICIIVLVKCLYNFWIVEIKTFLFCGGVTYWLMTNLIKVMQNNIWHSNGPITNSTGKIGEVLGKGIGSLCSENSVKTLVTLISSNFFAISQYTFGLLILGLVIILAFVFMRIAGKENSYLKEFDVVLIGGLYSAICFFIMFGGLCISYLYPALDALSKNQSYGGFFYIRYYYNFAVPLILYGVVYGTDFFEKKVKMHILSYAIVIFLCTFLGVVYNLEGVPLRDYWNTFGSKLLMDDSTIMGIRKYCLVFAVSMAILICGVYIIKYNKIMGIVLFMAISFYSYAYQNIYSAKGWADNYLKATNDFENMIMESYNLKVQGIKIYVNSISAAYGLQLRKPDYTIHAGIPDGTTKDKLIVVCNYPQNILVENGYYEIIISEDEIVYVNDMDLYYDLLNI